MPRLAQLACRASVTETSSVNSAFTRLCCQTALVGSPGLVLFDEPSQGLAPKIVGDVLTTIRQLRDEGIAVLIVEQNAETALSVADRAYVLDLGRLVWSGEAAELSRDAALRRRLLGV